VPVEGSRWCHSYTEKFVMLSRVRGAVARALRLRERGVGGRDSDSGSGTSIRGGRGRGSSSSSSGDNVSSCDDAARGARRASSAGSDSSAASSSSWSSSARHSSAVDNLNARGIRASETGYAAGFDTPEECRETSKARFFDLLCPGARGLAAENSPFYRALLQPFDDAHSSGSKFNEELFKAVGKCIRDLSEDKGGRRHFTFRPVGLRTDGLLVLAPKEPVVVGDIEYAAGLAREATLPQDRSSILSRDARLDHAAVLLRRVANSSDDDWEVWAVLAVVVLNVQGTGVRGLGKNRAGNVDHTLMRPLVASLHGPLAQGIMYTVAHALRGSAALGMTVPERIPFAVVSGRKKAGDDGSSKAREESHWVHGNVVVPEVCGFPYAFNVDAYGNLVEQGNHSSLASYLHVLAHGLKLACDWLKKASEAQPPLRKTPAPHRMSGRCLHFGTNRPLTRDGSSEAHFALVATPVSKYGVGGLRISQGELFKATVNLQKLRSSVSGPDEVFWCRDAYADKDTSVLVKVSSRSCFHLLVPPESAYLYRLVERRWMADDAIRRVLSKSLYGFYVTPGMHGLVQLLPDLQKKRYGALHPEDWLFAGTWSALWDSFAVFVTGTLVPLARYGIVHADLRAGYDVTSNVLYNPAAGSMRMIDLDSLCDWNSLLGVPSIPDKRNIDPYDLPPCMRSTALGFVLGQVLCVSEAWHGGDRREGGIRDAEVNADRIITEAAEASADVKGAAAAAAAAGGGGVDEALISTVLAQYRAKLREKYGKRRRPSGPAGS
jgi:hypothetical protein